MLLATLYALGHALVVFVLGVLTIAFSEQLRESVDGVMSALTAACSLAIGSLFVLGQGSLLPAFFGG